MSEICTSGQNKSLYPRHKGIAKYRLKVGAPDKKTTPNGVVFHTHILVRGTGLLLYTSCSAVKPIGAPDKKTTPNGVVF